ncbi:hypothetical protein F8M41_016162 [Gigaspora margarita]|uniref:Uncharacterized protein n=1 Tax=Gigaspora margarita TaxID=4874 RepID=A0A8H4APS2_GIGMA|nr:hypothetical protein F8M41_016162 [Gigaspora margarita]
MPLEFSSKHLSSYNKYDHCHKLLCDRAGKGPMVIACSHRYHESCFTLLNRKCYYCKNFLKLDIKNNFFSLLSWLSKIGKSKLNLKEIIEADKDSLQDQRIENKDDILEIFRKDKQALPKVEQAYFIALEKFLNTNIVI